MGLAEVTRLAKRKGSDLKTKEGCRSSDPSSVGSGEQCCYSLRRCQGAFDHSILRRIGINETRIHMQLAAIDQPRFHALRHRAHKQALKHFLAPPCPRFTEHAVIGNLLIQAVIQKPEVIEPLADHLHQLPLTFDVVKEEQEHHFQDHFRRHRFVAVAPVAVRYLSTRKRKINDRFCLSRRMIGSHPLLQIDRVIKELRLALLLPHHDGNTALTDQRKRGYYFF